MSQERRGVPARQARNLEPPLRLGDVVQIRGNRGPLPLRMLVVDAMPDQPKITVAYRVRGPKGEMIREWDLARADVVRVRNAW